MIFIYQEEKKGEFYQLYTRQIKSKRPIKLVFFPTHVKERKCPNSVLIVYLETISDENTLKKKRIEHRRIEDNIEWKNVQTTH
jgi:hypothetical protein